MEQWKKSDFARYKPGRPVDQLRSDEILLELWRSPDDYLPRDLRGQVEGIERQPPHPVLKKDLAGKYPGRKGMLPIPISGRGSKTHAQRRRELTEKYFELTGQDVNQRWDQDNVIRLQVVGSGTRRLQMTHLGPRADPDQIDRGRTVYLVGCSKTKLSQPRWEELNEVSPVQAWELYTGQLFKKSAELVNRELKSPIPRSASGPWPAAGWPEYIWPGHPPGGGPRNQKKPIAFIISAKYGLIRWNSKLSFGQEYDGAFEEHAGDPIQPYDQSLGEMSKTERAEWTATVNDQLGSLVGTGANWVILAPANYMKGLELPNPESVEWPLRGLGIGQQKQELTRMAKKTSGLERQILARQEKRIEESPILHKPDWQKSAERVAERQRLVNRLERSISEEARSVIIAMAGTRPGPAKEPRVGIVSFEWIADRILDQYDCKVPSDAKVKKMIEAAYDLGYLERDKDALGDNWWATDVAQELTPCPPPPLKKDKPDPLALCWGECGNWKKATREQQAWGISMMGPEAAVYGSEGRVYPVQYALVARDAVLASNTPTGAAVKGYRRELQARTREGKASRAQVAALAADLSAHQLLIPTSSPADGAPIVARVKREGPDAKRPDVLQVVSGNGRVAAMTKVAESKRGPQWFSGYLEDAVARWQSRPMQKFLAAAESPPESLIIVRIMEPDELSRPIDETVGIPESAVRLAGASQSAQSAELTSLEAGVSRARAAGILYPLQLGNFNWTVPVSAVTVRSFAKANPGWYQEAIATAAPARQASISMDPEAAADFINQILLGALPPEFTGSPLGRMMTKPRNKEALEGALPPMITLDSMARAGEIYHDWRLTPKLMEASAWVDKAGSRAISALAAVVETESRQVGLIEEEEADTEGVDPLAVGLAIALLRASRRADPATAAAGYLSRYVDSAGNHNPQQAGLFGQSDPGDPAGALAQIVNFKFTERTRKTPEGEDELEWTYEGPKRNPSQETYWGLLKDLASAGADGLRLTDEEIELLKEGKSHREIRGSRARAWITKAGRLALSVHDRQLPLFNPADELADIAREAVKRINQSNKGGAFHIDAGPYSGWVPGQDRFRIIRSEDGEEYASVVDPWMAEKALKIANEIGSEAEDWPDRFSRKMEALRWRFPCPSCPAKAGQPCRRPSGWAVPYGKTHTKRQDEFDEWLLANYRAVRQEDKAGQLALFNPANATAIRRRGPSAPAKAIRAAGLLRGRVLDYGCGFGGDLRHLGATGYDPAFEQYAKRPTGQFDTITATYVLNTEPPGARAKTRSDIMSLLRPGGAAYLTVRADNPKSWGRGQYRARLRAPKALERKGQFVTYELKKNPAGRQNPAGDLAPFIETIRVGPGMKRIINRMTGRDVLIAGSRGKWLMVANYNQPDAREQLGTFRSVELAEAYVAGEQDIDPRENPVTEAGPEYMLLGTRVDLVIDTGDDEREVRLTDDTVLATDQGMKNAHLVSMGRKVGTESTRQNEANWEAWTYGSDIDGRWEMRVPSGKKLRVLGEIQEIYYDGRLHEGIDGKSRRVHKFHTPYPRLIMLEDGLKIERGRGSKRSRYSVTERGIVG